jgi:hypothetical protein
VGSIITLPKPLLDWDCPLGFILDIIAEYQVQLHGHNSNMLEKLQAELESSALIQTMYDIGYLPARN